MCQYIFYYVRSTIKTVKENNRTAKGENEVIARCTGDTNITPGKGKGIMRWLKTLDSFKTCRGVLGEENTMKYNLRKIMLKAWENHRKYKELSFSECLHRAWLSAKAEEVNAQRIEAARMAAGVTEETNTWSGWKQLGYEVIHGSKALFGATLIWGSRGDNAT
jgi:hypothetical protein